MFWMILGDFNMASLCENSQYFLGKFYDICFNTKIRRQICCAVNPPDG